MTGSSPSETSEALRALRSLLEAFRKLEDLRWTGRSMLGTALALVGRGALPARQRVRNLGSEPDSEVWKMRTSRWTVKGSPRMPRRPG